MLFMIVGNWNILVQRQGVLQWVTRYLYVSRANREIARQLSDGHTRAPARSHHDDFKSLVVGPFGWERRPLASLYSPVCPPAYIWVSLITRTFGKFKLKSARNKRLLHEDLRAMIGLHNCEIVFSLRCFLRQTEVLLDFRLGTNGIFKYDLI